MLRAACNSIAESAIMNWIAWRSARGGPKVTRTFEYSIIMSSARRAMPTGRAPWPRMRPSPIHFCARENPPPTWPITLAAGTRTFSNTSCQGASPIIVGHWRSSRTPRAFQIDGEAGDAPARFFLRIGHRHELYPLGAPRRGDEALSAIDNEIVAIAHGARAHVGGV